MNGHGPGVLPVVGIIGTGSMGGAIARRVLASGHQLVVHDVRAEAVEQLAACGATVAPDPQTLAGRCDVVLLSLPSDVEVAAVVFGERGVRQSLRPGRVLVNLTTGSVTSLPRLAELEHSRGIFYLTAPVSQGADGAAAGKLTAFVAGSADGISLARPVLATFCGTVIVLRDHLAAMSAKLATNLLWFINAAALPEALALLARAGVPLQDAQAVLTGSCGDSWVARHDMGSVLDGTLDQSFTLGLSVKDLRLAGELAGLLGVPLEVAAAARTVFDRAYQAYGPNAPELSPVRLMAERTGIQLCPELPDPLANGCQPARGREPDPAGAGRAEQMVHRHGG